MRGAVIGGYLEETKLLLNVLTAIALTGIVQEKIMSLRKKDENTSAGP